MSAAHGALRYPRIKRWREMRHGNLVRRQGAQPIPAMRLSVEGNEGRNAARQVVVARRPMWGSFIDNIHADPARHRQGIGTGLFAAVVDWCRRHHPDCGLHLHVIERNANARRFYAGLGGADRGTVSAQNPWTIGELDVRRYAWATLDRCHR